MAYGLTRIVYLLIAYLPGPRWAKLAALLAVIVGTMLLRARGRRSRGGQAYQRRF